MHEERIMNSEELELLRYALEHLWDCDLSEWSAKELVTLKGLMIKLGCDFYKEQWDMEIDINESKRVSRIYK